MVACDYTNRRDIGTAEIDWLKLSARILFTFMLLNYPQISAKCEDICRAFVSRTPHQALTGGRYVTSDRNLLTQHASKRSFWERSLTSNTFRSMENSVRKSLALGCGSGPFSGAGCGLGLRNLPLRISECQYGLRARLLSFQPHRLFTHLKWMNKCFPPSSINKKIKRLWMHSNPAPNSNSAPLCILRDLICLFNPRNSARAIF